MHNANIKKLKKILKKNLEMKRYEHSISVANTAVALAMKYDADLNSAYLAGLLHDCAKAFSANKSIRFCEKHNISVTESELLSPELLHAKIGGFLAIKKYHVNDSDIINAILNHTTGRPEMSLLEKIIFVADYIEPLRTKAGNITVVRKLAFEDLDAALVLILKSTLEYLEKTDVHIDVMTQNTYEYYTKEINI